MHHKPMRVLIESDWNLKAIKKLVYVGAAGINRIRLEFKGYSEAEQMAAVISINRIRLEFKENQMEQSYPDILEY